MKNKDNYMTIGMCIGLILGSLIGIIVGTIQKDLTFWLCIGISVAYV